MIGNILEYEINFDRFMNHLKNINTDGVYDFLDKHSCGLIRFEVYPVSLDENTGSFNHSFMASHVGDLNLDSSVSLKYDGIITAPQIEMTRKRKWRRRRLPRGQADEFEPFPYNYDPYNHDLTELDPYIDTEGNDYTTIDDLPD